MLPGIEGLGVPTSGASASGTEEEDEVDPERGERREQILEFISAWSKGEGMLNIAGTAVRCGRLGYTVEEVFNCIYRAEARGTLVTNKDGSYVGLPGVAVEDRDRIFDRFYRSDRDRSAPGSGLGLAIVAKAAAEHKGHVWAREAQGGGAEVGFTLPVG